MKQRSRKSKRNTIDFRPFFLSVYFLHLHFRENGGYGGAGVEYTPANVRDNVEDGAAAAVNKKVKMKFTTASNSFFDATTVCTLVGKLKHGVGMEVEAMMVVVNRCYGEVAYAMLGAKENM
ncbi:hypothetical protein L6452_44016 [Arctium lappa]|uniref:Uncharacterized protein n=1 Tax=Arctium lappa TaxID=4217 RepID=A0ACB8XDZ1_ARCLA|nr:hypothetical protein L6452_44016 [Arctium lappa]